MGGIFDVNGRFMGMLYKLADLAWINVLTLLCCIPIFTAGAALTAMHTMVQRLRRDEEGNITGQYWKAFRLNFRQATLLWLISLFAGLVLVADIWLLQGIPGSAATILKTLVYVLVMLYLVAFLWLFVLQSRYENNIRNTIKNSFVVSLSHMPTTLAMLALAALPAALLLFLTQTVPLCLLFGLSVPAYVQSVLYSRIFNRLENSA